MNEYCTAKIIVEMLENDYTHFYEGNPNFTYTCTGRNRTKEEKIQLVKNILEEIKKG